MPNARPVSSFFYALLTIALLAFTGFATAYVAFDDEGQQAYAEAMAAGPSDADFYNQFAMSTVCAVAFLFSLAELVTLFRAKWTFALYGLVVVVQGIFDLLAATTPGVSQDSDVAQHLAIFTLAVLVIGLVLLPLRLRKFSVPKAKAQPDQAA